MTREWKPGDVAMARGFGCEFLVVRTGVGVNSHWSAPMDWPNGEREDELEFRPLVVIDPEDREAVERLLGVMKERDWTGIDDEAPADMQAALREYANPNPPKPDEPQGLGAVVEDEDGERWVRSHPEPTPWTRPHLSGTYAYANIAAARVLSPGVEVDQ